MFISVIIIAFDRKQFILDAIKSALQQTLSHEKYEIIVIKNYEDKKIDEFIIRNGIINIISNYKSLSGKLAEAMEIANGEIVSFLEDDDRFYNEKLETVYGYFRNDKNLVYYHNSSLFEDDKRNILPMKFDSPDFNLSSISIKKDIIDISALKSMPDAVDAFFYFNAIDSGGRLVIDQKVLTHYRYHGIPSNQISDFKTKLEHKLDNFQYNIENYILILKNLKTNNAKNTILNIIITAKIEANILCSLLQKKDRDTLTRKEIWFWLLYPAYYDRKIPILFKIIKYCELIIPYKMKVYLFNLYTK